MNNCSGCINAPRPQPGEIADVWGSDARKGNVWMVEDRDGVKHWAIINSVGSGISETIDGRPFCGIKI